MTDKDQAERGRLAQAVLDNPVYAESYGILEAEFTKAWRASRDPAHREELHQKLVMLDLAKSLIESVMKTGKIAEDKLRQQQSQAEKMALYSVRKAG